jgi:hypothetical protein
MSTSDQPPTRSGGATVAPLVAPADPVAAGDAPPRAIGLAWGFLAINTLGFTSVTQIIPFPRSVGQVITMAMLLSALGIALLANRRVQVRPNAYLVLLTLIALVSVVSSLRLESGVGSLLRCFRMAVFVLTLWLLSGWWRGDLRFVGYHVRALGAILLTVLAGLVISPGAAFSGPEGRLVGAIWPIPPPQVGLYCAIATGLCVLLYVARKMDGRSALVVIVPAVVMLLLSHTRTALLGLAVGLAAAGLSLLLTNRRARLGFGASIVAAIGVFAAFGGPIQVWLQRGQDADQLTTLTGRAKVWDLLLAKHRTLVEELFGVGLTDKSFDGLPIDSAWYAVYNEQGWIGIGLVAVMLVTLLGTAVLRPPSVQRACAIFLLVYGLVASYTEVGLGDASPYLLNLAVVASLLLYRRPDADRLRMEPAT